MVTITLPASVIVRDSICKMFYQIQIQLYNFYFFIIWKIVLIQYESVWQKVPTTKFYLSLALREKMKVSANCIFSIILTHLQIIVYRHNFGLWSDLGDKGDTMSNNQWEIESKVQ